MTSIPKPLKFIGPHYEELIEFYEKLEEDKFKKVVADFLSVMSMTMAKESSK
jgi:26S proteasome regulatory subunit N1